MVKCAPKKPRPSFHSTRSCCTAESIGLIQLSMVIPPPLPTSSVREAGTRNPASVPFKLKACPTSPATKLIPPISVPLFTPAISVAFPLPGHQLIKPDGGATQFVGSANAEPPKQSANTATAPNSIRKNPPLSRFLITQVSSASASSKFLVMLQA